MSGYVGNSNQGREGANFDAPIAILFEALGMNPVKSPGMGMPGETKAAFALQHESKMLLELLFGVVKTFHKTRKIGIGIVTEENIPNRSSEDIIEWQGRQKADILFAVFGIQILFVLPGIHTL